MFLLVGLCRPLALPSPLSSWCRQSRFYLHRSRRQSPKSVTVQTHVWHHLTSPPVSFPPRCVTSVTSVLSLQCPPTHSPTCQTKHIPEDVEIGNTLYEYSHKNTFLIHRGLTIICLHSIIKWLNLVAGRWWFKWPSGLMDKVWASGAGD